MEEIKEIKSFKKYQEASQIETNCPICLTFMVQPCTYPCKHTFCIQCTNHIFEIGISLKCPMCRSSVAGFKPSVNKDLQKLFKSLKPKQFIKYEKVLLEESKLEESKLRITFQFGNTHSLIPNPKKLRSGHQNKHEWTAYVKSLNKKYTARNFIRKVKFGLHQSFGATEQIVNSEPFEMTKKGYGEFNVPMMIYFHSWLRVPPVEVDYFLNFQGNGSSQKFTVSFLKEKVKII